MPKSIQSLENPTAMSLARRYENELRRKLLQLGNPVIFRDWFIATYWEDLPNSELTSERIEAAINYLDRPAMG